MSGQRPFWRDAPAPYAQPHLAERELLDHYRLVFEKRA
jgi:hypothetical protein